MWVGGRTGSVVVRGLLAIVCALTLSRGAVATVVVETIAGGGSLDGYPPTGADLSLGNGGAATGVALGPDGLYISDSQHDQVLKIAAADGTIRLVAGNGTATYEGDGLPAPSAGLANPGGLAFDASGNLYIADRGNLVVRRVDAASGVITTVAGTGLSTGQVVGGNPPAPLGDGGLATAATFSGLGDLTVDAAGAVIVADTGNDCVRKFTVGGTISTIAGQAGNGGFGGDGGSATAPQAQLNNPSGVAVDSAGNVYIGDSANHRVRQVDTGGNIHTVVGDGTGGNGGFGGDGGLAVDAQIGALGGLAFDNAGRLLITCSGADRVRLVDVTSASPVIVTIAGGGTTGGGSIIGDFGPATAATLNGPRDVVSDGAGTVYVYDAGNGRIRRVDGATGYIDTVAGTALHGFIGDRGPYQHGVLMAPSGAAFDAAGNLYVADSGDHAVRRIAPDGTITTFAGVGVTGGLGDGGPANLASLSSPSDVCVVGSTLYVADFGHDAIRAVDLGTNLIRTYADVSAPVAIVADPGGVLYVAHDNQVDTVALDGSVTEYAGTNPVNNMTNPLGDGLPAVNATLRGPSGLALGPGGELYVADTRNDRIRLIAAGGGTTSTVAGGGTLTPPNVGDGGMATLAVLNRPQGVALDGGRLVVSDTDDARIRAVDLTTHVITTIAGTGTAGFAGDGDVAAGALVNGPGRITAADGGLVFADGGNNRIRRIVDGTDLDPKTLRVNARLAFGVNRKTRELPDGHDTVSLAAALPLPAGVTAAALLLRVDVVDLHQQTQLDARGRQPKPVRTRPAPGFQLPEPPAAPASRFTFHLKKPSVAGGKPTRLMFTSRGTFRDVLGRAGFTDVSTPKGGTSAPVRVTITLGTTSFTGEATMRWTARQGRGGAAQSTRP